MYLRPLPMKSLRTWSMGQGLLWEIHHRKLRTAWVEFCLMDMSGCVIEAGDIWYCIFVYILTVHTCICIYIYKYTFLYSTYRNLYTAYYIHQFNCIHSSGRLLTGSLRTAACKKWDSDLQSYYGSSLESWLQVAMANSANGDNGTKAFPNPDSVSWPAIVLHTGQPGGGWVDFLWIWNCLSEAYCAKVHDVAALRQMFPSLDVFRTWFEKPMDLYLAIDPKIERWTVSGNPGRKNSELGLCQPNMDLLLCRNVPIHMLDHGADWRLWQRKATLKEKVECLVQRFVSCCFFCGARKIWEIQGPQNWCHVLLINSGILEEWRHKFSAKWNQTRGAACAFHHQEACG